MSTAASTSGSCSPAASVTTPHASGRSRPDRPVGGSVRLLVAGSSASGRPRRASAVGFRETSARGAAGRGGGRGGGGGRGRCRAGRVAGCARRRGRGGGGVGGTGGGRARRGRGRRGRRRGRDQQRLAA